MNYDLNITQMSKNIKDDKSVLQPWKNYALKELAVAQALIRMGKTVAPTGVGEPLGLNPECTCPKGGVRADCPVHGNMV